MVLNVKSTLLAENRSFKKEGVAWNKPDCHEKQILVQNNISKAKHRHRTTQKIGIQHGTSRKVKVIKGNVYIDILRHPMPWQATVAWLLINKCKMYRIVSLGSINVSCYWNMNGSNHCKLFIFTYYYLLQPSNLRHFILCIQI